MEWIRQFRDTPSQDWPSVVRGCLAVCAEKFHQLKWESVATETPSSSVDDSPEHSAGSAHSAGKLFCLFIFLIFLFIYFLYIFLIIIFFFNFFVQQAQLLSSGVSYTWERLFIFFTTIAQTCKDGLTAWIKAIHQMGRQEQHFFI